jgi:hypothetical protein
MSRVEEIEGQVEALSPEELSVFRRWFAEFEEIWDRWFARTPPGGTRMFMVDIENQSFTRTRCPRVNGFCNDPYQISESPGIGRK